MTARSPRTCRVRTAAVLLVLIMTTVATTIVAAFGLGQLGWTGGPEQPPDGHEPEWPVRGQAAVWVPGEAIRSSSRANPVPIASVAKIMTALVVLERFPLESEGFSIVITQADVEDTELARSRGESLVEVRAGEQITERQALLALMLPSANNMARILAARTAGSEAAFVTSMNSRAHDLGLRHTRYADASGFSAQTVSTAGDQTRLAAAAMTNPTFAWVVRQSRAMIPVAGQIETTDRLLGRSGFVGIKTGSHRAAGGCFVFAVRRTVDGRERLVVGAVLGQRGPDLTKAAFDATVLLVDSAAGT